LMSHKAIYKAIKNHDLDQAIKAMEKHMLDIPRQYSGVFQKKKRRLRVNA